MIVNISTELGYGLTEWLAEQGVVLYQRGSEWHAEGHANPQSLIDSYNPWPAEKAKKLAEIDADFSAATSALLANWPKEEPATWFKQEAEARAYLANSSTSTPMLSTIAALRSISVADLANRVVTDADMFTQASATCVGQRHKARQLVKALPDADELHRLPELWSIKFGE